MFQLVPSRKQKDTVAAPYRSFMGADPIGRSSNGYLHAYDRIIYPGKTKRTGVVDRDYSGLLVGFISYLENAAHALSYL